LGEDPLLVRGAVDLEEEDEVMAMVGEIRTAMTITVTYESKAELLQHFAAPLLPFTTTTTTHLHHHAVVMFPSPITLPSHPRTR